MKISPKTLLLLLFVVATLRVAVGAETMFEDEMFRDEDLDRYLDPRPDSPPLVPTFEREALAPSNVKEPHSSRQASASSLGGAQAAKLDGDQRLQNTETQIIDNVVDSGIL